MAARSEPPAESRESLVALARRSAVIVGVAALILVLLVFLWYSLDVLLLAFAGVLFGVFLIKLSEILIAGTGVPRPGALAIVVLLLLALIIGLGWLLAPRVADQTRELVRVLPESFQQLKDKVSYSWIAQLAPTSTDFGRYLPGSGDLLKRITGIVSTGLGAIFSSIVLLSVAIYIAADPQLYYAGILHLIPVKQRARAGQVFTAIENVLWWWLLGRLVAMAVITLLTWVGLWLLGIPLALTLAILAGLLNFVPNFGPIASVIPAALLALTQGPAQAGYVVLLYTAVQFIESYLLTPLIEQHAVSVPAALVILGQILLGTLVGGLGLILATPLLAAAMVVVKMLYVRDTLGDRVPVQS